ncbi:ent-kaurene synthase [Pochonia chlamydosporia 170]|uniref:Ent-kaurene synthase n=1 Tax=Pochonia chlamydosporia 170 TaxID=1380566 RepID=A0A179F8G8_METCM|nr:ent-kaurene synthase [Pochonia chlamydosporia 170]OAQ61667.1 ent-kaurene synthase [Pochonia chlamydosporia 170]
MTVASSFALSNGHDPSGLSNSNGHGDRDHVYVASLSSIADSLVQRAVSYYDEQYGFSTVSPQVYDTAWVAMITKTTDGVKKWLFPESFHYLIRNQAQDGSWGFDINSQTVGILDTGAALLALLRHASDPWQILDYAKDEIAGRIRLASKSLAAQLKTWNDITATNHIGVELIIPALLEYLRDEDDSLHFEFESKSALDAMAAEKLSRFRPEMLYEQRPSSALHSLEAFIGKLDFDRIAHHLFNGSMMASPSSTAAYLMNASNWDDRAEGYLQDVNRRGTGHGDGGIAGTYPIHYFEFNWTVATLLQAGFDLAATSPTAVNKIAEIVRRGFVQDRGRAIDVDDTAKGLLALKRLGQSFGLSPDVMIKIFEKDDGFATFGGERDRSVSSHCHVLSVLLEWGDRPRYASQIRKAAIFVCETWWKHDKRFKDKWHLSHLYPTMLMIEAFTDLLREFEANPDSGDFNFSQELRQKIAISLCQASTRTLLEQREDGSWEGSAEQTAYAIMGLSKARHLCFLKDIESRMIWAIERGAAFLKTLKTASARVPGRYWTSKTSYSVKLVYEAYVLAALKVSTSLQKSENIGSTLSLVDRLPKTARYLPVLKRMDVFSSMPDWLVQASLVETSLFVPLLQAQRLVVFPRDDASMSRMSKDDYIDIIPFTWVGCNNRTRTFAPTTLVLDMTIMALLYFQADEFMESVAAPYYLNDWDNLRSLVDLVAHEAETSNDAFSWMDFEPPSPELPFKVYSPLRRHANYMIQHAHMHGASVEEKRRAMQEFKNFWLTQVTQAEDNEMFGKQIQCGNGQFYDTARPFADWVRTTAADHVGVMSPYSWLCAWLSHHRGNGTELFPSAAEKYFATVVGRHLSTACRMYNDYGSAARDAAEGNVNSLCFPEFYKQNSVDLRARKAELTTLARYEERCLQTALDCLEEAVIAAHGNSPDGSFHQRKTRLVRYFCDVGTSFSQFYVLRDLSATTGRDPTRSHV